MDAMLNVLNSAPKVNKKRKPKLDSNKKANDQLATPLSPPLKSDSPLHSPSTLDLDSLSATQSESSIVNESLSFSEPPTPPTDYVPLLEEINSEIVTSEPSESMLKVEEIDEKPPQLKVYNIFQFYLTL